MVHEAIALRQQNRIEDTDRLLRIALEIDPDNYDALHMLGVLATETGNGMLAIEMISAAIRIDNRHAVSHYNLGNAFRLLKRHEEAVACYDRAILLKPDYARAFNNRANSLWDLKRGPEAVASYEQALSFSPATADTWHNRGNVLNELGQKPEAIASYQKALAAGGDAARLNFELAALGAGSAPAAAPELFVANLFDGYAEKFDQHLVTELNYQTPQATVDTVRKILARSDLDILDLGCGTGLCGPLLRPLTKTLTGVDLSQNMLNKAKERKLYDELVCGEIAKYLQTKNNAFDLIIATDVFVYIGDLHAVFSGAGSALRQEGLFAFSVEREEHHEFVLRPSKRYAHSESYLRQLADRYGLHIEKIEPRFIRKDGENDIDGLIAVLRRN